MEVSIGFKESGTSWIGMGSDPPKTLDNAMSNAMDGRIRDGIGIG